MNFLGFFYYFSLARYYFYQKKAPWLTSDLVLGKYNLWFFFNSLARCEAKTKHIQKKFNSTIMAYKIIVFYYVIYICTTPALCLPSESILITFEHNVTTVIYSML